MRRRDFLKWTAAGTMFSVFSGVLSWAKEAALKIIDVTGKSKEPAQKGAYGTLVQAMGYVADAKKAKRVDKPRADGKTMPAKSQFCTTCNFLVDASMVNSGKNAECQFARGVLVNGKGYCNTYAPHPKSNSDFKG